MNTKTNSLLVVAALALLYTAWLGAHWLPLGYADKELSASASRVWDVKSELAADNGLAWWTPNFMNGSSYAINHSRGFYLIPWIALSGITDLASAGKLMVLLAMFASALAMYGCARYFLKNDWAAALAAIVFLLHPAQLIRAAWAEHVTIALFFPFIPLLWWTFARMLATGALRDIALCALTACFAMWTDNKQAIINFLVLACYLVYWYWPRERRQNPRTIARIFGLLAGLGLLTGAVLILPGLVEAKQVKLFTGDPLLEWQKNYSFRSLFGLVDRDGAVTKETVSETMALLQTRPVTTQGQADQVRRIFGMQSDAPEKYAGLVALTLVAGAALFNYRRQNRRLFWFFIAVFMLSISLATGFGGVGSGNLKTFEALNEWVGVPGMVWLAILALVAGLILFVRRKLDTANKKLLAGATLLVFLALPAFDLLANLPYFREIRAPYSFYDAPVAFWCAILAAFFITDVVKARAPLVVAAIAVVMLLDFWPYQRPAKVNDVPPSTIRNLEAAYASLKSDPDWVKTYSVSGRYFHLLGPMYSGKPQIYEAFYNWQAPLGLGLLMNAAGGQPELLNLLGARYVVLDKSDPGMRGQDKLFAFYRGRYAVALENEDFLVLRNNAAKPYVSATTRACLHTGPLTNSAGLAVALSARNYTLVHSDTPRPGFDPIPPVLPSAPVALTGIELQRPSHERIVIRLTAPQKCIVVVNESYYPFWNATLNGQPAELLRVNCAQMGVEVGEGSHTLVLEYRPPKLYAASAVASMLGLIACVVLIVRRPATT